MANMSYCRFNNTAMDFDECADVLEDMINGEGKPLSTEEFRKAVELVHRALDVVTNIAEYVDVALEDLEPQHVDQALNKMQRDVQHREEEEEADED